MREILFRGMRKDNNEWIEGHLIKAFTDSLYIMNECSYGEHLDYGGDAYGRFHKVIDETAGQFTGLMDCKGNRIFEGDILNDKYTVVFNNGSFMKYNGVAYYELNETSIKIWELEITGSIHQSLTPNK